MPLKQHFTSFLATLFEFLLVKIVEKLRYVEFLSHEFGLSFYGLEFFSPCVFVIYLYIYKIGAKKVRPCQTTATVLKLGG